MYNTPVRFDGDIIITDPCYIINDDNTDHVPHPHWSDYVTHPSSNKFAFPKPENYPDCRPKTVLDCKTELDKFEVVHLNNPEKPIMFSPMLQAELDAYYKAHDEYCSQPHDDWDRCNCGDNMEALGITTYLCDSTIYGDWSCTTYDSKTRAKLGNFCADAGMVAVFLLDEVLKYNPNFDYHLERPWTTTLIKDFHGTVELEQKDDKVRVVGKGNVNFVGTQTGF